MVPYFATLFKPGNIFVTIWHLVCVTVFLAQFIYVTVPWAETDVSVRPKTGTDILWSFTAFYWFCILTKFFIPVVCDWCECFYVCKEM
jgi:hypothetical protein